VSVLGVKAGCRERRLTGCWRMSRVHRRRGSKALISFTITRADQLKVADNEDLMAIIEDTDGVDWQIRLHPHGSLAKGYVVIDAKNARVHASLVLSSKFRVYSSKDGSVNSTEQAFGFLMADRVHDGIVVSFAKTERVLREELQKSVDEYIEEKSGEEQTPQITSLVGLDEIFAFLQIELSKQFVINSFSRDMRDGKYSVDSDDTNCFQFLLSAMHALDSEAKKDWKRLLGSTAHHRFLFVCECLLIPCAFIKFTL
jgi:hypothetical protein